MKRINITHATDRIFVCNLTNGDVSITFRSKHGESIFVRVPRTFIPFEITNYLPKSDIVDSHDFRRCIDPGRKLLKLVSEEEALKFLEKPESVIENERITRLLNFSEQATNPVDDITTEDNIEEKTDKVRLRIKAAILENNTSTLETIRMEHYSNKLNKEERKYINKFCERKDVLDFLKSLKKAKKAA